MQLYLPAAFALLVSVQVGAWETTITDYGGFCETQTFVTLPLTVPDHTTTVTTTLPLTTTISVYPGFKREPQITAAPSPRPQEPERRELSTIHHVNVCTGTTRTLTHSYYTEITTPGTKTVTDVQYTATAKYTLCIEDHPCWG